MIRRRLGARWRLALLATTLGAAGCVAVRSDSAARLAPSTRSLEHGVVSVDWAPWDPYSRAMRLVPSDGVRDVEVEWRGGTGCTLTWKAEDQRYELPLEIDPDLMVVWLRAPLHGRATDPGFAALRNAPAAQATDRRWPPPIGFVHPDRDRCGASALLLQPDGSLRVVGTGWVTLFPGRSTLPMPATLDDDDLPLEAHQPMATHVLRRVRPSD